MSSSTFEVREAENENETDRVLGFGLEPCEENGIPSSQGDSEVAKDHTYTKGPGIVSEDADKTEESSESQVEVDENNETASGKTRSTRAAKAPKGNKPSVPTKSRPKREPAVKKDSPITKKNKGKKEILSEEGNTASEENVSDDKTDLKSSPSANANEESGRPKRKGRKRKLEEKENVLDRSIVEEIENIVEDSSANDTSTESPAKKKATTVEATKEKKTNKAKQVSGETEEDHNLPEGWVRKTVVRKTGKTAGQIDVYIYSPDGIKFRSRPDIAAYLTRTKSPFKLEDFNFSKRKLSNNTTDTPPTKKEKITPVKKAKLSSDRKKVQPVSSPAKKGPKLLVKLNFSPKSKKARNTKTEKQSKATKTPVKSGRASGAGSKGSLPRNTVGRRKKDIKQEQENEVIKKEEQDSKVSIDSSSAEETLIEQTDPPNMANTISSRPQRSVNRKSAIEMLSATKSVSEQLPVKTKSTVPATKQSPKMVKQDVSHEDNPNNEKLIKRNNIGTDANDETSGTKRLRRQKSKVEEKENVLYKSIVEEVQNIAEASKSNNNVEKLSNKETLSTSSYSSKEKINNENSLSPGEKAVQKELPQGWMSKEVKRKSGKTAGLIDIYIFSPEGIKFRSKRDLAAYLLKSNSDLKLDDFNFSKKSSNQPLKSLDTKTD